MKTFQITIEGKAENDIEDAIQEVSRLISGGYLAGVDSNESGRLSFDSSGDYENQSED
jgi:hypothetical protein